MFLEKGKSMAQDLVFLIYFFQNNLLLKLVIKKEKNWIRLIFLFSFSSEFLLFRSEMLFSRKEKKKKHLGSGKCSFCIKTHFKAIGKQIDFGMSFLLANLKAISHFVFFLFFRFYYYSYILKLFQLLQKLLEVFLMKIFFEN